MIYGVVGNREGWTEEYIIKKLMEQFIDSSDTIVSGGAEGVDTYAQSYAKLMGCKMVILYPDPNLPSPQRYFERNNLIAEISDTIIAFDKGSSSGSGTLNTINTAKKLSKKVIVYKE
jgi:predicted Rossmann fold nucleotide-binding protein DprA/Smf involved in DNA uptake